LGQLTEFIRRGEGRWSVSSIADRTQYPAPGLLGGQAGATGAVSLDNGTHLHAKALMDLQSSDIVHVDLPGGGGYGDPMKRDVEKVLWDVIEGYITPEQAETKYRVVVNYIGNGDDLVKLPEKWAIDQKKTAELRNGR
jgi:N-methylhydantoinase B